MEFIIKDKISVLEYMPKVPTYVIRILDCNDDRPILPLVSTSLFKEVNIYRFDDPDPDANGKGPMLSKVAEKLLHDFFSARTKFLDLQSILIHCNEGEARSPAVAAGLNEIFNLGQVTWRFSVDYPRYNDHVFKQLLATARQIGLYER
jgi:predicted protein tyrosine phosphatase